MPSAQDHALAHLAAQRGWFGQGPDVVGRVQALLAGLGPGQPLAQRLLADRLVSPAALTELLRDLARSSVACPRCRDSRAYDALGGLALLRCPRCQGPLTLVLDPTRETRTIPVAAGDTVGGRDPASRVPATGSGLPAVGTSAGSAVIRPARPTGAFPAAASRAQGSTSDERVIGGYTLVQELGRGSNGVVWLARRPGLERRFALKLLLDGAHSDAEALRRFQQEASLASKVEDPGIVGVFDVGRHGDQPYYVMEFVPGTTLEDRLKSGPIDPIEAARTIEQLARTVQAAHDHGVIHRDLKPANVILEDGTGRPRILDFGLAKDRCSQGMTRTGDVLGTPYYMAPEQIRGDPTIDHRIDVHALGVMLYQCLSGRRPYEAPTVVELARKIRKEPPPALGPLAPGAPERLVRTCERAMAKERDERHATARELALDLRGFLGELPSSSIRRAEDAPRPPARGGALGPMLGGLAVAGVAAAVVALAVSRGERVDAPAPPTAPAPAPTGPTGADAAAAARVDEALGRARERGRQRLPLEQLLGELDQAEQAAGADAALAARVRLARAHALGRRGRHAQAVEVVAPLVDAPPPASPPDEVSPVLLDARRIRALGLEGLGRVEEARETWQGLARLDPEGASGRAAQAALARLQPDPERALERARQALDVDPEHVHALLELGMAALARGDAEEARAAFASAERLAPDEARAHCGLGLALGDGRGADLRAALTAFDEAVRLTEPDPDTAALVARARLSLREGRTAPAGLDLDRALAREPLHVEALVLRGAVAWTLGARDAARKVAAEADWRRAWELGRERVDALLPELDPQARVRLRQVVGLSTYDPDQPPLVPVGDALRARLEGWAAAAVPAARRPLEAALVLAAEGRPLEMLEPALEQARIAAPQDPVTATLRARLLAGRDAYDAARAEIQRAVGLGAPVGPLELLEGETLWFEGRGNEAVKVWDRLAARDATSLAGRCAGAWTKTARDDDEGAVEATRAILADADPDDPVVASAHVVRIIALSAVERDGDAIKAADDALALQGALTSRLPGLRASTTLWAVFGRRRFRLPDPGEVDPLFEKVVACFPIAPVNARISAAQAAIMRLRGSRWFKESKGWLEEARRLEPRRAEVEFHLGAHALMSGASADDVIACWQRAREKDPRIQLPRSYVDFFRELHGDHPALERFLVKEPPPR